MGPESYLWDGRLQKEGMTNQRPRRKMLGHSCGSNILTYSAPPLAFSNSQVASVRVSGTSCYSFGRGFVAQKLFLSFGPALQVDNNVHSL